MIGVLGGSVGCDRLTRSPTLPYRADETCAGSDCRNEAPEDASSSSSRDVPSQRDTPAFETDHANARDSTSSAPQDTSPDEGLDGRSERDTVEPRDTFEVDPACSGGDGASAGGPPQLIYVEHSTEALSYLDCRGRPQTTSVAGDIRAIGPSLHYDDDGRREIPYVIPDGSNAPALRVVELTGDDEPETLDKNVLGEERYGRLGVADFDDDGQLGIAYPNASRALGYAEHETNPYDIVQYDGDDNAPPLAVMGGVRLGKRGGERIYWVNADDEVRYVTQARPTDVKSPSSSYDIGVGDNVGVGSARALEGNGMPRWPVVDSSRNPGAILAVNGQYRVLNESEKTARVPVAWVDVVASPRRELVFALDNGFLYYVKTTSFGTPTSRTILRVEGVPRLHIELETGVAPGVGRVAGSR